MRCEPSRTKSIYTPFTLVFSVEKPSGTTVGDQVGLIIHCNKGELKPWGMVGISVFFRKYEIWIYLVIYLWEGHKDVRLFIWLGAARKEVRGKFIPWVV